MQLRRHCNKFFAGFLSCAVVFSLTPLTAFASEDVSVDDTAVTAATAPADREVTAEFVSTGEITLYHKYTDDEYDDNLDPLDRYEGYVDGSDENVVSHDDGHTYWMPVKLALFTDEDGTLYYFLTRGDRENAMECVLIDPSKALSDEEWKHTDETIELNIPARVDVDGVPYDVIAIDVESGLSSSYSYYNGTALGSTEKVNNTSAASVPYTYYDAAVENRTEYSVANSNTGALTDGKYDFTESTSGMDPVTIFADNKGPSFKYYITGIHIPASVEVIDAGTFRDFQYVESFTFGADSQLREIGAAAFYTACASSCTIELPETLKFAGSVAYLQNAGTSSYDNVDGTKGRYIDSSGAYCSSYKDRVINTSCYAENPIRSSYGLAFNSCKAKIYCPAMLEFCTDFTFYNSGVVTFGLAASAVKDCAEYGFDSLIATNTCDMSNLESVEIEENDYGIYSCEGVVYQDALEGTGVGGTNVLCFPASKSSWTEMPESLTEIGALGFNGDVSSKINYALKQVVISDNVTSIGESAFDGCVALESVDLPSGLETIGPYGFYSCSSLTSIALENTSVNSVGNGAFSATGLVSITFPASVNSFPNTASCPNLTTVNFLYDDSDGTFTHAGMMSSDPALEEVNFYGSFKTLSFNQSQGRNFGNNSSGAEDFSLNLLGNVEEINIASATDPFEGWAEKSYAEHMSIRSWQDELASLVGEDKATSYLGTGKIDYEQLESVDDWSASIGETSYTYAGTEITPNVSVTNSAGAVASSDFTISCKNNVNVGTATASVIGAGKYRAFEQDFEFTIDPANLADADVRGTDTTYLGDAVTPDAIDATWNGMELAEGTDFEIVGYANNVKPGKAKVTVEGENNFTGEATGSFYIVVSDEDQAAVTAVEDAIAALSAEPTEEEVAVAQDAYDALSAAQKALVANAATLMDAQQYVLDQKIAAAQKAAEEAQQAADEAGQKATEAEEAAKQAEEAEQTAKDAQAAAEQKAAEAEQAYQDLLKSSGTESTELSNAKRQISELQNELASTKTQTVTSVTVNDKNVTAKTVASAISKAGGDPKYVVSITLGKKVKKIGKKAFAKCSKTTNLTVTSSKLAKKTVKKSLKGSKISVVQVKGKAKTAKKYAKIFTKKNAGKAVAVVKA